MRYKAIVNYHPPDNTSIIVGLKIKRFKTGRKNMIELYADWAYSTGE